MQSHRLFSARPILFGIIILLNIVGCSNFKTQPPQDDSTQIRNTVLEKLFLSIPTNLTKKETSQLLDDYLRDSLIWNVNDYSYHADNFEQILAEVNFGEVNYRFDTNLIVKMNDSIYDNTDPVVFLIFYNQKLLSLELEIHEPVIFEESNMKALGDSITAMYTNKYGQPSLRNKRLDTFDLGNINHEIDINETHLSDGRIQRRWKENVKSELTEWTFLNVRIKIIISQYKEYLSLNYKKEKPTELIWETVHIFYINNSTVADYEQDIKDYRNSIELQNIEKEKQKRIKDSLKNIKTGNIYIDQNI